MSQESLTEKNRAFLEKIMQRGNLNDIYDARDLAEIVFRTMRDLMPNTAVDQVTSELENEEKTTDIGPLWQDTNPLVHWLSRIRLPFDIDDEVFIRRVEQEGGMPSYTNGETVIKAVFAATKDELSPERVKEIAQFLPGKIQELWVSA